MLSGTPNVSVTRVTVTILFRPPEDSRVSSRNHHDPGDQVRVYHGRGPDRIDRRKTPEIRDPFVGAEIEGRVYPRGFVSTPKRRRDREVPEVFCRVWTVVSSGDLWTRTEKKRGTREEGPYRKDWDPTS